jgi:hypothetical protein
VSFVSYRALGFPRVRSVILGRTPKYVAPVSAALVVALSAAPGQAAALMTPAWPTTTVVVNTDRSVSGTVDVKQPTTVVLQQKVSGDWRNVRTDTTDDAGNFSLSVPTWWLGTRDYRVVSGGTASAPATFNVKPGYTPTGKSSEHAFLVNSTMARWDPCTVIGWRINVRQATTGALADTKAAFKRISQATGFTFRYRGTTTGIPQADSNSWYPNDTQIVVAWARKKQSSIFNSIPTADAAGMPYYLMGYHNGDGSSAYKISKGSVVIDSTLRIKGGFAYGITRGDLLMHELGHVMGLAHYSSSSEMMNPVMTRGAARYGRGDLAGLEAHGAELGCLFSGSSRQSTRVSSGVVAPVE